MRRSGIGTPGPTLLPLGWRSEAHTSELQSHSDLVCRLLLGKKSNVHRGLAHDTQHHHGPPRRNVRQDIVAHYIHAPTLPHAARPVPPAWATAAVALSRVTTS